MKRRGKRGVSDPPSFPGRPAFLDGLEAVRQVEQAIAEQEQDPGLFFDHWDAAVAARVVGATLSGGRAAAVATGQSILQTHAALTAMAGRRAAAVVHLVSTATSRHAHSVHAGHDGYHGVQDAGLFQLFASNVQEVADFTVIARRVAEYALTPGLVAQDGFLTSDTIESVRVPERELIRSFLGRASDEISAPTSAQRLAFGEQRRRVPELSGLDYSAMLGGLQRRDAYAQGSAAQRVFFGEHVAPILDDAFAEWGRLTGRWYTRAQAFRVDGAEFVIVTQGSTAGLVNRVAEHVARHEKIKLGVVNITACRPFPADLLCTYLSGKRGVLVLERSDEPLSDEGPLVREIRVSLSKAVENGRASGAPPHPDLPDLGANDVPVLYAARYGLGGRELGVGDVVAAVRRMHKGDAHQNWYLGIDFVRSDTRMPKLQIWQEQLLDAYPDVALHALVAEDVQPVDGDGTFTVRLHSIGGWGTRTTGRVVASVATSLTGSRVVARPGSAGERRGQPVTFQVSLAPNGSAPPAEVVDAAVCLDPNVFAHTDPVAALADGGALVIPCGDDGVDFWRTLPAKIRQSIVDRRIQVILVDAFAIANQGEGITDEVRRMAGVVLAGALFKGVAVGDRSAMSDDALLDRLRAGVQMSLEHLDAGANERNVALAQRGFAEARALDVTSLPAVEDDPVASPAIPEFLGDPDAHPGPAHPGRFWERVGFLHRTGMDGLADPIAALGVVPAGTSVIRDLSASRFDVPEIDAGRCTGCGECWMQCPDSALPASVNSVQEIIQAAAQVAANGRTLDQFNRIIPHISRAVHKTLRAGSSPGFGEVLSATYPTVAAKLNLDPERRKELDTEFGLVAASVADLPVAKTARFFDEPEGQEKGSGGLLSIGINPEACTGCMLCVAACPEGAVRSHIEDAEVTDRLRRTWQVWDELPEPDARFVADGAASSGEGDCSSLLLGKRSYHSMLGGDGVCPGCGERTVLHLVFSAVRAVMQPRVERFVARLDALIDRLDGRARGLLASDADLNSVRAEGEAEVEIRLNKDKQAEVGGLSQSIAALRDLRWRYVKGPSGKGRAVCGVANSAGASSVRESVYPYNPYPFPWITHLSDSPSVALGVFREWLRTMARGFAAVRRAELQLQDEYEPAEHDQKLDDLRWTEFTAEEWDLCPPMFAVGGDDALFGEALPGLHGLLASEMPVRVIVIDKLRSAEVRGDGPRKPLRFHPEPLLLALAHRDVFVLQSSQATPSHLLNGVLAGLRSPHPAMFVLHAPCPTDHGLPDDGALHAARLAHHSRVAPTLVYDPERGSETADRLSLDGNPTPTDAWSTENGPITVAHWALGQSRFRAHFAPCDDDDDTTPVAAYIGLTPDERNDTTPVIDSVEPDGPRRQYVVSDTIVRLADERADFWTRLKQMAGVEVAPEARRRIDEELGRSHEAALAKQKREFEKQLAAVKSEYGRRVARQIAEGLLRSGGDATVADLMERAGHVGEMPDMPLPDVAVSTSESAATSAAPVAGEAKDSAETAAAVAAPEPEPEEEEEEEELVLDPYIETLRCTACNECTNLNAKMFAYNDNKQAFIKDPRAGTFRELVMAAEKCPVAIIHPGNPLNPDEKDLEKWTKRAAPFN